MSAWVVVRVRGHQRIRHTIETTMKSLGLTRPNHCVILPQTPDYGGMVQKVKDYVTFGIVGATEIEMLLTARGRLVGDKPLTEEHVKKNTDYASFKELAEALADGKASYKDVPGVKPIFRLHPPLRGYKGGVKRSFQAHGSLGDRGPAMGKLLEAMV